MRRATNLRSLALCLVACVLAIKLVLAPGLMPRITPAGFTVTLCSGSGPVEVALDLDGERHDGKAEGAQQACAFAGLAAPVIPIDLPAFAPPAPAPFALYRAAAAFPPRGPPPGLIPPATGPPAFA